MTQSVGTNSDEECIDSDDEEELVLGHHIIMDLVHEDNEERGLMDELHRELVVADVEAFMEGLDEEFGGEDSE